MGYHDRRAELEDYFGREAAEDWARLTSGAPVSRIRRTVRAGRAEMRAALLAALPEDLAGARILDAGCGTGAMAQALARRGADVVAADISPALLTVARARCPEDLAGHIMFVAADMTDDALGHFDHAVAMDSLIHYEPADIGAGVARLARRTAGQVVFTVAPATPLLRAMWLLGRAFPRRNRAPAIRPMSVEATASALRGAGCARPLRPLGRVSRGFYFSQAMEVAP